MALVLRGRLVTRQQLLDMIADRDHWRDSTNALLAAVHEQGMAVHDLGRAVDRLTALGETSNHALTEIQRELERGLEQRP